MFNTSRSGSVPAPIKWIIAGADMSSTKREAHIFHATDVDFCVVLCRAARIPVRPAQTEGFG
jgi:hypothetical protein